MRARPDDDTRWAAAGDEFGRSFGTVVSAYAAWRPGHSADVVAFLVGGPGRRRVRDLGGHRAPRRAAGHDVVAVDRSADMLPWLAVRLPGVPTFVTRAERLPLPDGDVDVVVAGQAAHWFDATPDPWPPRARGDLPDQLLAADPRLPHRNRTCFSWE